MYCLGRLSMQINLVGVCSGLSKDSIQLCLNWMAPYVGAAGMFGRPKLREFGIVKAEDKHNIQTHTDYMTMLVSIFCCIFFFTRWGFMYLTDGVVQATCTVLLLSRRTKFSVIRNRTPFITNVALAQNKKWHSNTQRQILMLRQFVICHLTTTSKNCHDVNTFKDSMFLCYWLDFQPLLF